MKKKQIIKKSKVKFEHAVIKVGQIEITTDGPVMGTRVKLDGEERRDIGRIEIVIDAHHPMALINLFIVPHKDPQPG